MKIRYLSIFILILIIMTFSGCEECEIYGFSPYYFNDGQVDSYYQERVFLDSECFPALEDYFLIGGILPPGLRLTRDGYVEGTPTRRGEYFFTIGAEVCFEEDFYGYYDCYYRSLGYSILIR